MNWEAIAATGEILGAVAVLVTLIYLAAQIRQNTATVATATYDSVLNEINNINIAIAQNEALASIVYHGMYDPDSLSEMDRVRFSFVFRGVCNQWLKMFRLHEKGVLTRSEFELYAAEMAQVFRTPGGRMFRDGHKVYAELFAALDELEAVQSTAFKLGEEDPAAGSSPDPAT